ncbi:PAS domain S-box protein [Anaerobacillus isosaccharinicus]|uniref:histidine kinase n=1 Tax=Anaerobacillus isosaccharinicus TaxID=1532552 RepID=A0A1S2M453_9BACI|nr:PAS domain-containing sensor histidine kinase [Anaerobacillus isosaccharinicus]MBA5586397.1 PAS domain S-box protein [Anaerobacillus isosaccharinicus]QOY35358.1 PAS domain S-box protein [Anaerobacillus isosaccharinicus]
MVNSGYLEHFERLTDGIYSLDIDWNFTYCNDAAARILKQKKEDLLGKNLWEQFPQAVDHHLYFQYHKAMREQQPVFFEMYYPPLDTWFNIRTFPSITGLTVYFQDITEQRRHTKELDEHYKSLFHNNIDAVFSFNLSGYYLSVNLAMEKMLGYYETDFLQMSFEQVVTPEETERVKLFFSKAAQGETQNYETKAIHQNGDIIDVKVTNIPITLEDKIVGVYGIAKDIRTFKRAEEVLIQTKKLRAVGELAASIAHEIRNPLTSIKGFLQLIKEINSDKDEFYFDILEDELGRIEMITGELLVLAKPQAKDFKFRDISKIIEDVIILLGSQALIYKVEIQKEIMPLPKIKCAPNQLKQVFINLIKNAIEAMPNGGKVSVNAQLLNDHTINIRVIDQGVGIPKEFLDNLGTPFYTTKEKGTGLGLMTTIKIIQEHKGTIDFTSDQNCGTKVEINLPLNK